MSKNTVSTPKTTEQLVQELTQALIAAQHAVEYAVIERDKFREYVLEVAGQDWKSVSVGIQKAVKELHAKENAAALAVKAFEQARLAFWAVPLDGLSEQLAYAIDDLGDSVMEALNQKLGTS